MDEHTPWLINGGDPKYLLSGMILQVVSKLGYVVQPTCRGSL